MNIFKQRAEEYLGISFEDKLSKADFKRLRAKVKKMKVTYKKSQRKANAVL